MRRAYQVVVVGAAIGVICFSLWWAGRSSGGVSWKLPITDVVTGNRLTNASAYYVGYKGYPVVSNFGFLPAWMRGRTNFTVKVRDGYLYVPQHLNHNPKYAVLVRISAPGYRTGALSLLSYDPGRFLKETKGVPMAPTNYVSVLDLPITGGAGWTK